METCVVRVWLPDRPGALGQVASRIGALRADVVGIDILERGGGQAVDELTVVLPQADLMDQLVAEIGQVDGVAIEDVRRIDAERPDAGLLALEIVAATAETGADERLDVFCAALADCTDAAWVTALDTATGRSHVSLGQGPDTAWLAAFLAGSSHLTAAEQAAGAPGDLAWSRLGDSGVAVVIGRPQRLFHTRERQQIALLGRIAGAISPSLINS